MNDEYDPYSFVLNNTQRRLFEIWKQKFDNLPCGAIGGLYTFSFTPTTIGTIVKVKMEIGHGKSARIETLDLTGDFE